MDLSELRASEAAAAAAHAAHAAEDAEIQEMQRIKGADDAAIAVEAEIARQTDAICDAARQAARSVFLDAKDQNRGINDIDHDVVVAACNAALAKHAEFGGDTMDDDVLFAQALHAAERAYVDGKKPDTLTIAAQS